MIGAEENLSQQQQILKILDIGLDVQVQNEASTAVLFLNGKANNMPAHAVKDYEMQCRTRKRNLSDGSDCSGDSQLLGSKDIIYIDTTMDDSLQKLALKYNCSISELKLANKIYNDVELHAKKTVKIPVLKDGQLYADYHLAKENNLKQQLVKTDLSEFTKPDLEGKYKFRVQTEYEIKNTLDNLSSDEEGDDDIFDIRDAYSDEHDHLLEDRTKYRRNDGNPVDGSGVPINQYMERMDKEFQKNVAELEIKNGNLNQLADEMGPQVIFPPGPRPQPEKFGSVGTFTWAHVCCMLCVVAVIIPAVCFIYFYESKKS